MQWFKSNSIFYCIDNLLSLLYISVCRNHILFIWRESSSTNTSDLVLMLQDVCLSKNVPTQRKPKSPFLLKRHQHHYEWFTCATHSWRTYRGEAAISISICQAPCQTSCSRPKLPSSRGVNLTLRDVVVINWC